ncbi:alpha beta-hydrolase [Coniophora puteana RWD-64-598 SS2]|uniref:Alpha beta-hydrolase n=1 Tax=Coniophora puteana (strain RWD-64-598) TaxID=741705 RepID=A0A5M3MH51_CONPW|nr:alpha beta-hydrolase [Coniophora puteana RWD-64-598 SS2]EIW77955.1 alpha beta-hydrolase [Coniophora puteana RWD-64-598 SS2]
MSTFILGQASVHTSNPPNPTHAHHSIPAPDRSLVTLSDGKSLHVELTGPASSDLTPVVFVHGLGGSSATWTPLLDVSGLAKTRPVLTFDLEGHGLSPLYTTNISIESYTENVKNVMDGAGVQRAVIVGHSMGGLIVTTFAAKYPERTEKLCKPPSHTHLPRPNQRPPLKVLIGPVKSFAEAGVKALGARAEAVRTGGMSAVADTVAASGISQKSLASRPLAKGMLRASLLATPAFGYALACLALTKALDPDYAAIGVPTLILAGDEDRTCPEATVRFLEGAIGGAKVVTLRNVGHWHIVEDVEGTARELRAFVG